MQKSKAEVSPWKKKKEKEKKKNRPKRRKSTIRSREGKDSFRTATSTGRAPC